MGDPGAEAEVDHEEYKEEHREGVAEVRYTTGTVTTASTTTTVLGEAGAGPTTPGESPTTTLTAREKARTVPLVVPVNLGIVTAAARASLATRNQLKFSAETRQSA